MGSSFWKRGKEEPETALRRAIGDFELPRFPAVVLEAMRVLRDENASVDAIAEALRADPGLSVRLLGLVNSAGFGLRHAVDDLPHAVQLMGRAPLESLLITLGTRQAVSGGAQRRSEQASFWQHAARRAAVASRIASIGWPSEKTRLFTAALLQDMAVPLLRERHEDAYTEILELADRDGARLADLERERFGWDHAEVGRVMCEVWKLPAGLGDAVGAHHLPPAEASPELAPLLLSALVDDTEDGGVEKLLEAAEGFEGLDGESVVTMVEEGLRDAEDVTRLLG